MIDGFQSVGKMLVYFYYVIFRINAICLLHKAEISLKIQTCKNNYLQFSHKKLLIVKCQGLVGSLNGEISLLWERYERGRNMMMKVVLLTDCRLSLLGGLSLSQADQGQNNSEGFQGEHDDTGLLRDLKLPALLINHLWGPENMSLSSNVQCVTWVGWLLLGRSCLFDDQSWTEQVWPMLALQAAPPAHQLDCSRRDDGKSGRTEEPRSRQDIPGQV